MATPTPSRILKVTRSSCTSARGQSTSSRKRLGTPSALRLRGAASRIRFSNPPLNPRTHPGRGGVHEEADPEQVGLFFSYAFSIICRHSQTEYPRNRQSPVLSYYPCRS